MTISITFKFKSAKMRKHKYFKEMCTIFICLPDINSKVKECEWKNRFLYKQYASCLHIKHRKYLFYYNCMQLNLFNCVQFLTISDAQQ